jgi:GntR family transcriptional repressor for pyruvate dehydrogenase complex
MKKGIVLEPIKKVKLNDAIIKRLIALIQKDLSDGDKLPSEKELLEHLHIGRSSLREALRAVETMGLIEVRAGAGSFVTKSRGSFYRKPIELGLFAHDHTIKDMIQARYIIEVAIVDLVVQNVTDAQLDEMERAVGMMEEAMPPNLDQILSADVRFHELLNAATGNSVLHELVSLVYHIVRNVRTEYFSVPEHYAVSAKYHRNILEALKRRDPRKVRRATIEHMEWVKSVFLGAEAGD